MQARIVGVSLSVEPGTRVLHPARAPLCGRARPARPRGDARAARAVARRSGASRSSGQNLKYDQHALANHGLALAGVAHDTLLRVLRARVAQAARHGQPRVAPPRRRRRSRYDDVTGKGANRIGFDQVAVDRATEYSAEDADVTLRLHGALLPADRGGREARLRLRAARDAGARGAVPHGAQRHPDRLARCSRARAASWASASSRSSSRRTSSPGSRSTWARRSSWARSCSRR